MALLQTPEQDATGFFKNLIEQVLGKAAPPSKYDMPAYKYPGRRSDSEVSPFSKDLPPEPESDNSKDILNAIVRGVGDPMNMMNPIGTPIPALIKGGRIAPELVPKASGSPIRPLEAFAAVIGNRRR